MTTTLATRLATARTKLNEQAAYRRRVEAFGLPALLAPYAVRVPEQRR